MTVDSRRIYLSWQSSADGRRHIVGRVERIQGKYRFVYTQGGKESPVFAGDGNVGYASGVRIGNAVPYF